MGPPADQIQPRHENGPAAAACLRKRGGALISAARFAPRLADLFMERWTFAAQPTDEPANGGRDNLFEPVPEDGGERGQNWTGHTRQTSLYTSAFLHPKVTAVLFVALALSFAPAADRVGPGRGRRRV